MDDLPRVHKSERALTCVDRMEAYLRSLDGPLSISTARIPDVATPDATDLGYPESLVDRNCEVIEDPLNGRVAFCEPPNRPLAGEMFVEADEADVIEDLSEWA